MATGKAFVAPKGVVVNIESGESIKNPHFMNNILFFFVILHRVYYYFYYETNSFLIHYGYDASHSFRAGL